MQRAAASFPLALLVLLSSLSLQVNLHFCGDHLREVSLLGEAGACCAAMANGEDAGESGKGCCHDESVVLKAQDDPGRLASAAPNLPLPAPAVLMPPPAGRAAALPGAAGRTMARLYRPPRIVLDLPVLLQIFRI